MNAKEEFIKHINQRQVKCASIQKGYYYDEPDEIRKIHLKVNYTKDDYNQFLKDLDFTYDNGFGGQELFGIIWYTDGTWSERGEYDGSEWWEYNSVPEIPKELL